MKKTVAKRATVLLAILVLLALSLSGLSVVAFAEGNPTVGAFTTNDAYKFNGTSETESENKTTVSYNWTTAGTYLARVNVANYTGGGSIELSLTPVQNAHIRLVLFGASAWNVFGADAIADTEMTAGEAFERTISLAAWDSDLTSARTFDLGFYFDSNIANTGNKKITVNKLSVGGVSYTPTEYTPEAPEVQAPEKSFKELADWTVTNGTKSANTLEKLTGDEANGTVDNAAGDITANAGAATVTIEVPLSETLPGWPNDWSALYVKFKATNIASLAGHIEEVAAGDVNLFCADILGSAWNAEAVSSVTEGYKLSTVSSLSTYFGAFKGDISKIVLVATVKDTSAEAKIEFGGMTFASTQPKFVNDISSPDLSIGEWAGAACYTLTPDAEVTVGEGKDAVTYSGLKVEYSATTQYANVKADVTNYDFTKHPKLRIGFYSSAAVKVGVYANIEGSQWDVAVKGHADYKAGYNSIIIDLEDKVYKSVNLYIDSAEATTCETAKTLVFDSVTFYTPFNVAAQDSTAIIDGAVAIELQDTTDGSIQWTCETTNGASYSRVKVPVEHWYKFDRYVLLDVTLDSPLKLGVYFNAGSLLEHAALSAGRYKLCLDTRAYNNWESFVEDGDNILLFYCDAGSGDGVVAGNKKVTVHSISFAETAEYVSSPDSSKASVNFANETVSIEEGFEASASADFNALLENGSAIAPGSMLYVRGKDASTAATEIKLPARPTLSAADAPTPTKGENYIRFGDASFEYKMGDGEWAKTGSWGNLTAGTEYTVYVRKAATETAFRSEEVELKITTNGTKPSGGNDGDNNGGDNSEEQPAKKKCGSQVGSQAVAVGMLLVLAAGAVIVLRKRTAK
ncbi:hypothetical protein [Pumilibacter muris]|uniref:hypothetical protein n=1 Tax=Pumilibacter muris TaxID=2941510 RepID=UPI00203CD07F|nr:hypothetical protein [Pumilibacter muris]